LLPFGLGAHKSRVPVAELGRAQRLGRVINNVYFQEILGPRTFGSLLNVGAGDVATDFRQAEMFAASEFHTLEMPRSGVPATYHCLAENMDAVPSERYDWVISLAVLEHTTDPWAVAREMLRVTKPGGFIYTQAPFAFPLHYGDSGYGDFWRFSPSGLTQLFPGCRLRELEVWGDAAIMANGYSVLVQKQPSSESGGPPAMWIDFPNGDGPRPVIPNPKTEFRWPLYHLTRSFERIAALINTQRTNIWNDHRVFVPIHEVARELLPAYTERVGTVGFRGDQSFIEIDSA